MNWLSTLPPQFGLLPVSMLALPAVICEKSGSMGMQWMSPPLPISFVAKSFAAFCKDARLHHIPRSQFFFPDTLPPGISSDRLADTRTTQLQPLDTSILPLQIEDNWRTAPAGNAAPYLWTGSTTFTLSPPPLHRVVAPFTDLPPDLPDSDDDPPGSDSDFKKVRLVRTPQTPTQHPVDTARMTCSAPFYPHDCHLVRPKLALIPHPPLL